MDACVKHAKTPDFVENTFSADCLAYIVVGKLLSTYLCMFELVLMGMMIAVYFGIEKEC